jgi:hypothetical protein
VVQEDRVTPHLLCRICGVEVILSEEPVTRMAELATFYAAHRGHEEGLSVEATFDQDEGEEAG